MCHCAASGEHNKADDAVRAFRSTGWADASNARFRSSTATRPESCGSSLAKACLTTVNRFWFNWPRSSARNAL